ncbi:glucose 1-dehydrogenase [Variovorax sp. dw_308]|uniref:glucose 1-dehydrogenase n=1 Tax=Variovorax sp. dw_308 TaxID=2721546 RepID=UPI001C44DA6D|nr:glucose 1-dehydrogenase [Variovorax sp. dw_308]
MGRLDSKVAVITGGASGIGEASVRLFAREGAKVVIADLQDERGRRLADELGPQVVFQHTDVSREADVQEAIDVALSMFGRLDCLFNNAGIPGPGGPIENLAAEGWDHAMAVLVRSAYLGMKHAAPIMKRQGSGSIVSTASVAGLQAGFSGHAYAAAKAAVINLTRSVATELGESGVRVNCICPGGVATPIFGRGMGLDAEEAERSAGIMLMALANVQPLQRAGVPDDIANAALWLASDDSSFVNGHALVVDGGISCGRLWSESNQRREMLRSVLAPQAQG